MPATQRLPAQNVPSYAEKLLMSYDNCVNALNVFQAESQTTPTSQGPTTFFETKVAFEKFVGSVMITASMLTDSFKTPAYKTNTDKVDLEEMPEFPQALKIFHAITELFEEKHLWRERPIIGES